MARTARQSAEKTALAVKGLLEVEQSFPALKTPLQIRPVYHWSEPGVRSHITSSVLALLLARRIEQRLEATSMSQQAPTALAPSPVCHLISPMPRQDCWKAWRSRA
ncbi:MAG: hypothetical protein AB1609_23620 [Bacillota bacterium]